RYMEKRFGKSEAARRIIATTDPKKGALRKLADEQGYQTFEVPGDIGGRYSVLTPVGIVPLALSDFSVYELMSGADRLFSELEEAKDPREHPVLQYATSRMAAYEAGKRIELLSYAE